MAEPMGSSSMGEVTSDDKIWAAIGYPIPLLPILALLMEEKKKRPFVKYHAVQSLVLNVVLYVLFIIVSTVTLGFGAFCWPLLFLFTFWPAYEAYQGKYLELPVLTNFIKSQRWV